MNCIGRRPDDIENGIKCCTFFLFSIDIEEMTLLPVRKLVGEAGIQLKWNSKKIKISTQENTRKLRGRTKIERKYFTSEMRITSIE